MLASARYEIQSALGAGGMGEVYKARDTRLDRTVAIKVLPESLAADAQFKERFDREARAISQLTHPHICTLYDVGRHDTTDFLVLEYLEGETLADRLARSKDRALPHVGSAGVSTPAIAIGEALTIAIQIASALDKAHRAGITHRDLKPANIFLTKNGAKLLDFGLAKAGASAVFGTGLSMLPTTPANLTAQGTILGTFQYMAPEQLEGKDADARTDIFAFGSVVYEMITGRKAFEGKSQVSLIGAILEREPTPLSTLQPTLPPAIDRIVRGCLAKDPAERWQSAGDLAVWLKWVMEAPAVTRTEPRPGRTSKLWLATASVFIITTIALAAALVYSYRTPSQAAVVQFFVSAPDKTVFESGFDVGNNGFTGGSISPDGRTLAFTAKDESGKVTLWVRALDTLTAKSLPGTEGAAMPFWSPDSRSIGFFGQAKLKRIDVEGGPPQTLSDAPRARGGSWNREGVIIFAPSRDAAPLSRVSSAGGETVPVTKLMPGQTRQGSPSFLPDGRHFLYFAQGSSAEISGVFLGSLDSADGQRLVAADSPAVYAPPGYVLFIREGTLLAQPFDARKLQLNGEPVGVAEQVGFDGGRGAFSVSDAGILEYRTGGSISGLQLTWVDRSGKSIGFVGVPGRYQAPDISPDGTQIAVHRHDGIGGDVWLLEVSGGKTSRLTFDALQENSHPIWSPDGSRIVFGSRRNAKWGIYLKPSNGAGNEELLFESELTKMPMSWSGDGKFVLFYVADPKTGNDVWALPLAGDRKPFPVLQTPFGESHPQISPDGKWFAYYSNETGRAEVYVQSFPPGAGKWQISSSGGQFARWRRDGRELFYMDAQSFGKIVAVGINATGSKFEYAVPRPLFDSGYINLNFGHAANWNTFAVSADGQRFLIPRPESSFAAELANTPITVVLNWTSALKK